MAEANPLVTAEVGAARLGVCVADITTLKLDAIVKRRESHAARRWRRRRRHPPSRRAATAGGMPDAGWLRDRRRKDHARLSASREARDSRRGSRLERPARARTISWHRATARRSVLRLPIDLRRSPFRRSRPASTAFRWTAPHASL